MNNKKTKRVTIADLAKMIKESVVDRMATKEDITNMATKDDIKNMATKDDIKIILTEITAIHEDNKYFRQSISTLYSDGISYDKKIDNLTRFNLDVD